MEVIAKNDNFSHYKVSDGVKYSRMNQVKFVEDSLQKIWSDMVCPPEIF